MRLILASRLKLFPLITGVLSGRALHYVTIAHWSTPLKLLTCRYQNRDIIASQFEFLANRLVVKQIPERTRVQGNADRMRVMIQHEMNLPPVFAANDNLDPFRRIQGRRDTVFLKDVTVKF